MHIYLRHPIHGNKVAISEMEAAADSENGWVVYTVGTPSVPDAAVLSNGMELKRRRRTPPTPQGT